MPDFPLANAYWPAQTCTPLRESTIGSILRDAAARAPDKIALIDGNPGNGEQRQWTYRVLLSDAEDAARALLRRFAPGERIAVWSGNSPEWLILEFAAALAGPTLVTVNPAYLRTGDTAACDAVGEICTRGYLVMRGYLNAPEATSAAIDADGWPQPATSARWTSSATCGSPAASGT
jgi:acyl-CoA synthetase (AMP-forming)/AMP-acid ligase II